MSMRLFVAALAAVGAGAMSLALADPSATTPATEAAPVTAPSPSAPATPATPSSAAKAATPEVDPLEKHLLAEGYHPEMQNGQKVYCRKEATLGSRLGGQRSCGTADQIKLREDQTKESVNKAQRASVNPKGS
jgi:hypothetical protein